MKFLQTQAGQTMIAESVKNAAKIQAVIEQNSPKIEAFFTDIFKQIQGVGDALKG